MALQKLNFTRVWTNPEDFPTYEAREEVVRADMQLLFDEIRTAFNKLIDDLAAEEIPFTSTLAIEADNIQSAIENVQAQLADVVLNQIPDNTVTGDKLVEKTIGTRELEDDSVGEDQLAPDSVGNEQLQVDAVRAENIQNGAVTYAKTTGLQRAAGLVRNIGIAVDSWTLLSSNGNSVWEAQVARTETWIPGDQKIIMQPYVDNTLTYAYNYEVIQECGVRMAYATPGTFVFFAKTKPTKKVWFEAITL